MWLKIVAEVLLVSQQRLHSVGFFSRLSSCRVCQETTVVSSSALYQALTVQNEHFEYFGINDTTFRLQTVT